VVTVAGCNVTATVDGLTTAATEELLEDCMDDMIEVHGLTINSGKYNSKGHRMYDFFVFV